MQNTNELLRQIALGYLFNYRNLGVSTRHTYTDITSMEISYFAQVGECLGYMSMREKYRADLIWVNLLTNKTEMYLERETENVKAQQQTLGKLIGCRSKVKNISDLFIRIGIFGWIKPNEYAEFEAKLLSMDNSLFISWLGVTKDKINEVRFVVNSNGKTDKLQAQTDCFGEYWRIFTNEPNWITTQAYKG